MGQALRKLKSPPRPALPEAGPSILERQSVDIKHVPPKPKVVAEPGQNNPGEWNQADPNFTVLSQQVVGSITSRPAGKQEHLTATSKHENMRPMPMDRHTTLLSGPDEDAVQSPGTLNHMQMRELFLLHQGIKEGPDKPFNVESLAKRFDIDAEVLQKVFHYTTLIQFEDAKKLQQK